MWEPWVNFKEVLKNKELYAEKFCEGNKELYELLITLWNKGIEMVGCCIGHGKRPAYVGFSLKKNKEEILKILSNLPKDEIRIGFTCQGNMKGTGIYQVSKESEKDIFKETKESLNKNGKPDKKLKEMVEYIDNLNIGDDYLNIRMKYLKGNLKTQIITTDPKKIKLLQKIINMKKNITFIILIFNRVIFKPGIA